MYAVFATGGKQYRAVTGEVLMVGEGEDVKVGSPYLKGGKVTATIVEHGRGEKIRILKFKRRKHHMKRMGHRQDFTRIEITGIVASAPKKKVAKAKVAKAKVAKPKAAKPEAEAKSEA
jgi:large subunit ribosomal protein L21